MVIHSHGIHSFFFPVNHQWLAMSSAGCLFLSDGFVTSAILWSSMGTPVAFCPPGNPEFPMFFFATSPATSQYISMRMGSLLRIVAESYFMLWDQKHTSMNFMTWIGVRWSHHFGGSPPWWWMSQGVVKSSQHEPRPWAPWWRPPHRPGGCNLPNAPRNLTWFYSPVNYRNIIPENGV